MQWHPARWCGVVHAGWRADIDPAHDRCRSIVRCPNDCTVGIVGGYLCGDGGQADGVAPGNVQRSGLGDAPAAIWLITDIDSRLLERLADVAQRLVRDAASEWCRAMQRWATMLPPLGPKVRVKVLGACLAICDTAWSTRARSLSASGRMGLTS